MREIILGFLLSLAAGDESPALHGVVCDAAVSVAYAIQSPVEITPPPPDDVTPPDKCCGECGGTGKIKMPDGHVVDCPCPPGCSCKKKTEAPKPPATRIECRNGKCVIIQK